MRFRIYLMLFCCLGLTACGGEKYSELRKFVKDADNLPRGRIAPLPEVKPFEPFNYDAYNLLDPFKPRKIEPPKGAAGTLQPDLTRRKEPLEAYPLENLHMVGTIQQGNAVYALVKTPDNNLFRVKTGNYMGQNFGLITEIDESSIKLKEIVQDSTGDWTERTSSLTLVDDER